MRRSAVPMLAASRGHAEYGGAADRFYSSSASCISNGHGELTADQICALWINSRRKPWRESSLAPITRPIGLYSAFRPSPFCHAYALAIVSSIRSIVYQARGTALPNLSRQCFRGRHEQYSELLDRSVDERHAIRLLAYRAQMIEGMIIELKVGGHA